MKSKAQYFTFLAVVSTVAPATADIIYGSLQQTISTDYTGVTVASSTFASDPSFDPVRGIATAAGNIVLQSASGKQAQVNLSVLGKVGICTPSGAATVGYPAC